MFDSLSTTFPKVLRKLADRVLAIVEVSQSRTENTTSRKGSEVSNSSKRSFTRALVILPPMNFLLRRAMAYSAMTGSLLHFFAPSAQAERRFQPEDLFRIRQVGAVAWSANGLYATVELTKAGRTLDSVVPANDLALLDVKTHALSTLSSEADSYLGFFNAVWSPNGQRLAFLSVDSSASIQLWIWTAGTKAAIPMCDLDVRVSFNDPPLAWIGNDRIAVLAWDRDAEKSGDLYFRILRGRNVADGWKRAFDAKLPSVSVLESGNSPKPARPSARLVALDLGANTRATLARGSIHRLTISMDGRFLSFLREEPGIPGQPVASFFERGTDAETGYMAVNWGTAHHVIDARTGAEVPPSSLPPQTAKPVIKPNPATSLPHPEAHWLAGSPIDEAALYTANLADGTHLWLCGGTGQPRASCAEIWHANEWVQDIQTGRVESIAYQAIDGTPLKAWLLLPPNYTPGVKLPMMTVVYPGTVYGSTRPSSFSLLQRDFEHPQLFAARGYAVLLPSMPSPKDPAASHALEPLVSGVLPALDAVIARGIADPNRMAVLGQSNGGFATLGLLTQTTRFRSAIASASSSDLVSLYGMFYGQYRYGDAGPPQKGQVLRMLQMEKGDLGLGGPPWSEADRYHAESPLFKADKVQTPLMLIHGDLDFIPIQQAEEFFTALYRQDKRAAFVRYQGEWHTIANRANVLDLWKRMTDWLSETLAVHRS